MNKRLYSGKVNGDNVSIFFDPSKQFPAPQGLDLGNSTYDGFFVDVGTPH